MTNTPQKIIKRNEYGLIEGIDYIFKDDGSIDWRAMIPKEFLVVNKQHFISKNKEVPNSIDGLKDNEILSLLMGSKTLLSIRGFTNVKYKVTSPNENYVVAACEITFIPNYETEGKEVVFSAIGDASLNNTSGFAKNYLGPIAENRALVRCVRNFLRINVVSTEEIGGQFTLIQDSQPEDPSTKILNDLMEKYKISFDKIKEKLISDKIENAENFSSLQDIPKYKIFELIAKVKGKYETK